MFEETFSHGAIYMFARFVDMKKYFDSQYEKIFYMAARLVIYPFKTYIYI